MLKTKEANLSLIIAWTSQSHLCVQAGEPDLAGVIVLRVEQVTELRQQFRPGLQLAFRGYGCDQDTFMIDNIHR